MILANPSTQARRIAAAWLVASTAVWGLPAAAQAPAAAKPQLDPALLMQGFPPPPEYRIHIGNWQDYPQKIWSFQHMRELFPTRGLKPIGAVPPLASAPLNLDDLQVGTAAAPMTWPQMLAATYTDAILVLHRGRIVDERYFNGMKPGTPHLMFSATKSMVGLMGAVLVAEGKLDPDARVAALLPELADSVWADATVRQVLDISGSAAILREAGIRRVVLVTEAFHMPRAVRLFRAAGLEVVPAPTQFKTAGHPSFGALDLLPQSQALRNSYFALQEWLGIAWLALTVERTTAQ